MGLFGSIGKVFGGALKVVGKAAGVASAVAPIPGLGFAGKIAQAGGKLISGARNVERTVNSIMPGGSRVGATVPWISTLNVMAEAKNRLAGNVLVPPSVANGRRAPGGSPWMASAVTPPSPSPAYDTGAPAPKRRKRKKSATRRRATSRRRTTRRRGRRLSRAQLRAGFGGKRRMRRR